jgi:hypothetical protein
MRRFLIASLVVVAACNEPTTPTIESEASRAPSRVPPSLTSYLWGSSTLDATNPGSLFTIDTSSAAATLVGTPNIPEGDTRISAIDFDPVTGTLYGIKGGPCYGALLITIDPTTGAGTLVDTLKGGWFDGTPGPNCPGGSAAIAFAADGTLYASGWYGGIVGGKIMKVDKATAAVLEVHPTPVGYDDWRGRRAHLNGLAFDANGVLWASRGNSVDSAQVNIVDPATGDITSTLRLNDPVMQDSLTISDLAFAPDGRLYASLPWEGQLATIDTATGDVTRIGTFGADVFTVGGLSTVPRLFSMLVGRYWLNEAQSGQSPSTVADDQADPVDLTVTWAAPMHWTLQDGNRGVRSDDYGHRGVVSEVARSTKYEDNLHLESKATFVIVASWTVPPDVQAIGGFQIQKNPPVPVALLQTDGTGIPTVIFKTTAQARIEVAWPPSLADDTRRVFHMVYDSGDPVPERRIRLYVDGVDQGTGQLNSGSWPALGEGLDMNDQGLEIQLMNRLGRTNEWPMKGTVFYFAVYKTALSDTEIGVNATQLLTSDDSGPP